MKDYQQRIVNEKAELDEKREKLEAFLFADDVAEKVSQEAFELLTEQLEIVNIYSRVLYRRIALFDVEEESKTNGETREMTGADYIGKANPAQMERGDVAGIKGAAITFIHEILEHAPPGRRRNIAITHIEEAAMMAVKSIFEG